MKAIQPEPYSGAVRETARRWAIRVRDPDFSDWEDFTRWLEEDPDHAGAYDVACDTDEAIAALFAVEDREAIPLAAPIADRRSRPAWRRIAFGGGAAAMLAAVLGYSAWDGGAPARTIETRPGVQRTMTLADGSRIILNGDTRLILDPDTPRLATLASGEAIFRVRHDADAPFVVKVAGARLVDVGTTFDVTTGDAGALRVAVAEGAVLYNPKAEAVRLDAGMEMRVTGDQIIVRDVAAADIGSWRHGMLVFHEAPIAEVADALERSLGVSVQVSPDLASTPFTGTLAVTGDRAHAVERLAPLLGASARRSGDGWMLFRSNSAQP
ncbi:FecR family protein [Stakelama saccharophila]|uniref:FecR domain-containing protein n=1 Tax=Stakelama saccharophila TaxID=3075605 RepID=A0ABZ0BBQ7_9SPHN|nr:FecR domain-containing protein [Stakelama sp. W311]WNO54690.1 FecR domain-containing protein [Stakelama sp. W311]